MEPENRVRDLLRQTKDLESQAAGTPVPRKIPVKQQPPGRGDELGIYGVHGPDGAKGRSQLLGPTTPHAGVRGGKDGGVFLDKMQVRPNGFINRPKTHPYPKVNGEGMLEIHDPANDPPRQDKRT